jgi:hypothetical protein
MHEPGFDKPARYPMYYRVERAVRPAGPIRLERDKQA